MLRDNPLDWLLEQDDDKPSVRYFALRDLLGAAENDKLLRQARTAIMRSGPVPSGANPADRPGT